MGEVPKASLYANHMTPKPVKAAPVGAIVASIAKAPAPRAALIAEVRAAESHGQRAAVKGNLPGVTWFGTFKHRNMASLEARSGYVYVDVDALKSDKQTLKDFEDTGHVSAPDLRRALREDALKIRAAVVGQDWCAAAWLSASAFGIGVLVKGTDWYSASLAVAQAVDHLCCEVDNGASDVSRLNYLSHDETACFNADAVAPPKVEPPKPEPAPAPKPRPSNGSHDRSRNSQIALACIHQGLVGDYPAGCNTYGHAGQMTVAISEFCDGDEGVKQAWLDKLEADGRYQKADKRGNLQDFPAARHGFEKTWRGEGGITQSNAGVFINKALAEAKRKGLPSPFGSDRKRKLAAAAAAVDGVDFGW